MAVPACLSCYKRMGLLGAAAGILTFSLSQDADEYDLRRLTRLVRI
jgi:hypothetical protein